MIKYLFLLLICNVASANTYLAFGFDVFETQAKGYSKSNQNAIKNPFDNVTGLAFSILKEKDKYFYGYRTNALLQFDMKNNVFNLKTGARHSEISQTTTNSLFFGRKLQHFSTYVTVSRLDTRTKTLTQLGTQHFRDITTLIGAGIGFKLFDNQSLTFTYFFVPKNHKTVQSLLGVSYTFYFKKFNA